MSSPAVRRIAAVAERIDANKLLYFGLGAVALSFFLGWWNLTKYRIAPFRGTDPAAVRQKLPSEDDAEYQARLEELNELEAEYRNDWNANVKRNRDFYEAHVGEDFLAQLVDQDHETLKKGVIVVRGWSTWTAWFGLLFGIMLAVSLAVPKFQPELEPWAWGFPWAGALLFVLYTLMAVVFYFSVPDKNGAGYAQGVGLGNYLALLGGSATVVACSLLGKVAMEKRLADLEADADEEEDDEADVPPPQKNRLMDW